jgi:hypothetical protein
MEEEKLTGFLRAPQCLEEESLTNY